MEGGRRKRRGPPVLSSLAAPSSPSETSSIGSSLDFLLPSTSKSGLGASSSSTNNAIPGLEANTSTPPRRVESKASIVSNSDDELERFTASLAGDSEGSAGSELDMSALTAALGSDNGSMDGGSENHLKLPKTERPVSMRPEGARFGSLSPAPSPTAARSGDDTNDSLFDMVAGARTPVKTTTDPNAMFSATGTSRPASGITSASFNTSMEEKEPMSPLPRHMRPEASFDSPASDVTGTPSSLGGSSFEVDDEDLANMLDSSLPSGKPLSGLLAHSQNVSSETSLARKTLASSTSRSSLRSNDSIASSSTSGFASRASAVLASLGGDSSGSKAAAAERDVSPKPSPRREFGRRRSPRSRTSLMESPRLSPAASPRRHVGGGPVVNTSTSVSSPRTALGASGSGRTSPVSRSGAPSPSTSTTPLPSFLSKTPSSNQVSPKPVSAEERAARRAQNPSPVPKAKPSLSARSSPVAVASGSLASKTPSPAAKAGGFSLSSSPSNSITGKGKDNDEGNETEEEKPTKLEDWYGWLGLSPDRPEDRPYLYLADVGMNSETRYPWEYDKSKNLYRHTLRGFSQKEHPLVSVLRNELTTKRAEAGIKRPSSASSSPKSSRSASLSANGSAAGRGGSEPSPEAKTLEPASSPIPKPMNSARSGRKSPASAARPPPSPPVAAAPALSSAPPQVATVSTGVEAGAPVSSSVSIPPPVPAVNMKALNNAMSAEATATVHGLMTENETLRRRLTEMEKAHASEIETVLSRAARNEGALRQEADRERIRHREELKRLSDDTESAIERAVSSSETMLKAQHKAEVTLLKAEVQRAQSEAQAAAETSSQADSLKELASKLASTTEQVHGLSRAVEGERVETLGAREQSLVAREKYLMELESNIASQQKAVEQERTRMQSLMATMEATVRAQKAEGDQERIRLQRESARLAAMQSSLQSERDAARAALDEEHKEAESLRASRVADREAAAAEISAMRREAELETGVARREAERRKAELDRREARVSTMEASCERERELLARDRGALESDRAEIGRAKVEMEALRARQDAEMERLAKEQAELSAARVEAARVSELAAEVKALQGALAVERANLAQAQTSLSEGQKAFAMERVEISKERRALSEESAAASARPRSAPAVSAAAPLFDRGSTRQGANSPVVDRVLAEMAAGEYGGGRSRWSPYRSERSERDDRPRTAGELYSRSSHGTPSRGAMRFKLEDLAREVEAGADVLAEQARVLLKARTGSPARSRGEGRSVSAGRVRPMTTGGGGGLVGRETYRPMSARSSPRRARSSSAGASTMRGASGGWTERTTRAERSSFTPLVGLSSSFLDESAHHPSAVVTPRTRLGAVGGADGSVLLSARSSRSARDGSMSARSRGGVGGVGGTSGWSAPLPSIQEPVGLNAGDPTRRTSMNAVNGSKSGSLRPSSSALSLASMYISDTTDVSDNGRGGVGGGSSSMGAVSDTTPGGTDTLVSPT